MANDSLVIQSMDIFRVPATYQVVLPGGANILKKVPDPTPALWTLSLI